MRKMIKVLLSAVAFSLCGVQAIALAGPIIMPRVYIAPVRVAPVIAQPARVTPPPARVSAPAPKAKQADSTVNSIVPIMTGIAVMNATSSANAASSANDPSDSIIDDDDEENLE